MPIKIPNGLPAESVLQSENIFVMKETRALSQEIRPLRILLLNLMPKKIETETQLSRLLGNTPLQVELELIHTSTHESQNTSAEHLLAFYKTFDDVKDQNFDGLIITGQVLVGITAAALSLVMEPRGSSTAPGIWPASYSCCSRTSSTT